MKNKFTGKKGGTKSYGGKSKSNGIPAAGTNPGKFNAGSNSMKYGGLAAGYGGYKSAGAFQSSMKSKGMYSTAAKLGTAYVGYKVAKGAGKAIGRGMFGGMPRIYGSQSYYYGQPTRYRYLGNAYDDCDVFYDISTGKEQLRCDRDNRDFSDGVAAGFKIGGWAIFMMIVLCCCCCGGCCYFMKKQKKKSGGSTAGDSDDDQSVKMTNNYPQQFEPKPYETQPFTTGGYPSQAPAGGPPIPAGYGVQPGAYGVNPYPAPGGYPAAGGPPPMGGPAPMGAPAPMGYPTTTAGGYPNVAPAGMPGGPPPPAY